MAELKDAILDYVKKEYLEEDDDREIILRHAADLGRHRRFLFHGLAEALPGDQDTTSRSPTPRPPPKRSTR